MGGGRLREVVAMRVDCNKTAIKCRPKKVTVNKNIIIIWYSYKVNLTAEE